MEPNNPDPKQPDASYEMNKPTASDATNEPAVPRGNKKLEEWIPDLRQRLDKPWIQNLIAFAVPLLVMWAAYALVGVFPFGKRHTLQVDQYHQYAPFMAELQRKLKGGESLFFSWTGALGVNFWGLIGYYLASPLNLLVLIFPNAYVTEVVMAVTLIKIGLAGMWMQVFLTRVFPDRNQPWMAHALSTFYALSGYVMAYSWNMMWLDSVALLPLAAYGLALLLRKGQSPLFIAVMAMLMISNFYTGFFAWVFIGLYYFVLRERLADERQKDPLWRSILLFGAHLVIAAGIAMFMILPVQQALSLTSAANDQFPKSIVFVDKPLDYFGRMLAFIIPTISSDMPNVYSGVIALVLLPLYLSNRRLRLATRLSHLGLLLFLYLSFDVNVLDFIWHGLHYPNQLAHRYAYVLVFLLLAMCWDGFRSPEPELEAPRRWFHLAMPSVALVFILQRIDSQVYTQYIALGSAAFLMVYAALMTARDASRDPDNRRVATFLMASFLLLEVFLNTWHATPNYFGERELYSTGKEVESVRRVAAQIKSERTGKLTRMEILPERSVNDPMIYGLNGLTIFASTVPKKPVALFNKLGYPNNGVNSYQYRASTLLLDSLLGINDLIWRGALPITEKSRIKKIEDGSVVAWENPYALPLAYYAPENLSRYNAILQANPFENQNRLAEALGADPEILVRAPLSIKTTNGVTVSLESADRYRVTRENDSTSAATFELEAEEAGTYYVAWRSDGFRVSQVHCKLDDTRTAWFGGAWQGIGDIGWLEAGQTVQLQFGADKADINGVFTVFAARLDEASLSSSVERLRQGALQDEKVWSDGFSGRVTAPADGWLFISTTWNPGWQITVGGQPAKLEQVDDSLLRVRISAGTHEVVGRFRPVRFWLGLWISVIFLLMFLVLFVGIDRWDKRKQKPVQKDLGTSPGPDALPGAAPPPEANVPPVVGMLPVVGVLPETASLAETEDASPEPDLPPKSDRT